MNCYPTTIGKDFLLWLLTIISNETKMLPLKMDLPSLGVALSQTSYSLIRDSYHQEYSFK